ncbi:MAG: hypothetical protein HZB54_01900 [Deltaproteobacteria bacterium]|nr:hypothetical protein [Deltaproteobacteria bacterium]
MEPGHHHEIVNLISNVGFSEAFLGAFSSFFSIWQFCIAQISPFFMVFLIGVYLIKEVGALKKLTTHLFITSFGYLIGFSIIFALLGASGTGISGYLLYNIKSFRILSGIFILLTAILMIAIAFVRNIAQTLPGSIFWILAPFMGASFAFIYSPCIPPTLSQLLNYASVPENAVKGLLLLIIYGIGLSTAFISVGVPLAIAVGWQTQRIRRHGLVIFGCAFFLMAMGIMVITGLMVYYKAFLLSFFVE